MSKSRKDRINYFKHHEVQSPPWSNTSKRVIAPEDVPADVKDHVSYDKWVSLRHGNNRNYEADVKRNRAKVDRLHRAEAATEEVQEYINYDPTSPL